VDVTVTGSILSQFADILAELFVGPICDGVEAEVVMILNHNINKILNKKILQRQGQRLPLKKDALFVNVAIDTTVPYEWKVTKDRLIVGFKGLVYD